MLLNCGVVEETWTTRRSNQSILKEIFPGCSLEGVMLKLKLQYFGHLMWRVDSFEMTLMLGKIEGKRRRRQQRMRRLDGITNSMDMGLGGLQDLVMDREAWRAVVYELAKNQTWLSNWTDWLIVPVLISGFDHSRMVIKDISIRRNYKKCVRIFHAFVTYSFRSSLK